MELATDTETTGLFWKHGCRPFLISNLSRKGWKVFQGDVNGNRHVSWNESQCSQQFELFEKAKRIIFHNALFDIHMLNELHKDIYKRNWSIPWSKIEDTMLMSHLVNSKESHKLKDLALKYLYISDKDQYLLQVEVNTARRKARSYNRQKGETVIHIAGLPHPHLKPAGIKAKAETTEEEGSWWHYDMWLPKYLESIGLLSSSGAVEKYCDQDTYRTMGLWMLYRNAFNYNSKEEKIDYWSLYESQKRLLPVIYEMESIGIKVKNEEASSQIESLNSFAIEDQKVCNRIAKSYTYKEEINLNSSPQLQELFYDKWKNRITKYTDSGNPSTDGDTRIKLKEAAKNPPKAASKTDIAKRQRADQVEFLDSMTKVKKSEKSRQQVERFLRESHHSFSRKNGRIVKDSTLHFHVNPTGTKTTRVSSDIQQVSKGQDAFDDLDIDEEFKRSLKNRRCFGPRDGYVWYAIDYVQLQLQLFAYLSNQKELIDAFKRGEDFHEFMAKAIFKLDTDTKPTSGQRRIAKNTNFGFIFGASPGKIEQTARKPGLWKLLQDKFPNAIDFLTSSAEEAKQNGYVTTSSKYPMIVPSNEPFKAVNYKVQGEEGWLVKQAMIECYKYCQSVRFPTRLALQVHDELVFEVRRNDWEDEIAIQLSNIMYEITCKANMPVPVEITKIENNWAEGINIPWTPPKLET
tara:strand:+ start:11726 stop:13789 length:2064 start_codon:yes stop_codon:yes gene_type:complete